MTTLGSDDRAALPDPRLDAAWRAASNEAPPAALDSAILAAARREVGAGPRSARAQMPMDVRRRWWPLAAAATIAAIAVGVMEFVTPDQLSAPSLDKTIVSDMPPSAKPALDAMTSEEPAKQIASNAASGATPVGGAGPQSGAPRQEASSPRPAPRDDAAKATASAQRRASSGEAQRPVPSSYAQRIPSPFPAAPADSPPSSPANSQASARASEATSAQEAQASEAPPAPAALAASAPAPAAMAPAPTPSAARVPAAAPAFAPAPASVPPPRALGLMPQMSERSAPLAKTATAGVSTDQATEARAKDGTPLPIPDWIAFIRRLRAEGKVPEAAKELAAFRAAHTDHEKLLPPDLSDWHPPAQ